MTVQESINKRGWIGIGLNSNSPIFDSFDVIKESQKAVCLKGWNGRCWLPKSALYDATGRGDFTFRMFFRKLDDGRAISKAWYRLQGG